jgi:hypothetical protein
MSGLSVIDGFFLSLYFLKNSFDIAVLKPFSISDVSDEITEVLSSSGIRGLGFMIALEF